MKPAADRQPIRETERLSLQPLAPADAAPLFVLMYDPKVMAYWDVPEIDDPLLLGAIVEGQVAAMAAGQTFHWAIRTLADGDFVGCCSLSEIDRWRQRGELGFRQEGLRRGHILRDGERRDCQLFGLLL